MGDDVKILAVAAGSAAAAIAVALLLARAIGRPLRDLAGVANTIAGGELSARTPVAGPAELRELSSAFNTMADSVEGLFDARRELISWASHDLRTPLASLRALVEAAEDGLVEPDEYLPRLREQAAVLTLLVDDLFELARIDAGALALERERVELTRFVPSTLRLLEPEASARSIHLDFDVPAPSVVVAAPQELERVLVNLLGNAIRHTPPDGSVAVRVERVNGEVRVHVEDTGRGLDPRASERMFERFWRADRARSGGGAGLGLAIAKALVEAHGGTIWAENRTHGGARVSFSLPAA
ncbi:HAMP domain-containing sensor histidine kinase [Gaiella sp.]|uniref:HAMP domain-containing sensor histidine kinase n=1 Tax=Gaiella sp. TaxID=2663207 RepID=UPI0039C8B795